MSDSIVERLKADTVAAMKAKDKDRVGVLRMLSSALKDEAIKTRADVDDETATRILMSYAKKREETLAEMTKAGRDDLAEKERRELSVVREYLPEPMDDAALEALVREIIAEVGASSMKDMGQVMKTAQERVAGRAPGGRISALVKSLLSG